MIGAERVTKAFGGVVALEDVTIRCLTGEVTAVIGSNGSGKTTLLNILSGLGKPDRGVVFVGSQYIRRHSVRLLAHHRIVRSFQDVRLVGELSIAENVVLGRGRFRQGEWLASSFLLRKVQPVDLALVGRLLEKVGLLVSSSTLAKHLSFGQRKLLSLTRRSRNQVGS